MGDLYCEYNETKNIVLNEISNALSHIEPKETEKLVDDIVAAENVFVIGVGRVMMSLQAFVKRLTHIGIRAHCVGDITEPAITEKDILIVASGSGESVVPVAIAKKAREISVRRIIHIGSNPHGSVSNYTDYMVRIPVQTRLYLSDEIKTEQIMTSLFEQALWIYCDILSMMILKKKRISIEELWKYHANLE